MHYPGVRAVVFFVVFAAACVAAGLVFRACYAPEWMESDLTQKPPGLRPWAVEADCYSQLARVQRILEEGSLLQNHFTVEDWPHGLNPSTTAPFDYAILLLYFPLWLFTRHPLDWAGALVSPVLWLALVAFWMLIRSREFTLFGRALLIAGSAALPALVWATACGRPRHQSLILVLMAMGLSAEYERWHLELSPKRAWNIFAGIVWGLACWTSLFEPAVVLGGLILFNLIVRRREDMAFLGSCGLVLLLMTLLEGRHLYLNIYQIAHLPPAQQQIAWNWLHAVVETQPTDLGVLLERLTFVLIITPLLAWWVWPRATGNRTDALMVLLTFLLIGLTLLQARWSYYASLGVLLLVARACQMAPARWTRVGAVAVFAAGLIYGNVRVLSTAFQTMPAQPSLQLARISAAMDGPGGIMAPWWLSPGLLYFSRHPIVSGSSHCGLDGIADSARFYSSSSWADAETILKNRQVRWVVIWDDPRLLYPVLNNSLGILGRAGMTEDDSSKAERSVAQLLGNDRLLPTSFHLRAVTQQMKLYEYTPGG